MWVFVFLYVKMTLLLVPSYGLWTVVVVFPIKAYWLVVLPLFTTLCTYYFASLKCTLMQFSSEYLALLLYLTQVSLIYSYMYNVYDHFFCQFPLFEFTFLKCQNEKALDSLWLYFLKSCFSILHCENFSSGLSELIITFARFVYVISLDEFFQSEPIFF